MTMRLLVILLLMLLPDAAQAGLTRATLDSISVQLPPNARLNPTLSAPDTTGKQRPVGAILAGHPGFVTFVDYTCRSLCGTALMLLSDGIRRAGLKPSDVRIIVLGLDPKDSARSAIKMETDEIAPALRPATTFLLPNQTVIARATKALGFRYAYDPGTDQFAHPAIVYAVGPDGRVRATLSPLALTAGDLRRALDAPQSQVLSLYQRIHALCYSYDPVTGLYTPRIKFLLKVAGWATLLLLGTAIALLRRARWRRS